MMAAATALLKMTRIINHTLSFKAIKEEGYKTLKVGDRVKYQLAQGKNGLQCVNVYLA